MITHLISILVSVVVQTIHVDVALLLLFPGRVPGYNWYHE